MKKLFLGLFAFVAAPLAAQDLAQPAPEGGEVETVFEDEGGLTGSTTDENDWSDLSIAIPGSSRPSTPEPSFSTWKMR